MQTVVSRHKKIVRARSVRELCFLFLTFTHSLSGHARITWLAKEKSGRAKGESWKSGKKLRLFAYESRRSGQGMRLATSGLSVAKRGAAESFHRHFDEILDAGVLQDVLLRGVRLEYHVIGEHLGFLVAAARNRVALRGQNGREMKSTRLLILRSGCMRRLQKSKNTARSSAN